MGRETCLVKVFHRGSREDAKIADQGPNCQKLDQSRQRKY